MPAAAKNGARRARGPGPYCATRSAIVAWRGAGAGRIGARQPATSAIAPRAMPMRRTVAPRPNPLTRQPRSTSRTLVLTVLDVATTRPCAGQIARPRVLSGGAAGASIPHGETPEVRQKSQGHGSPPEAPAEPLLITGDPLPPAP